MRCEKAWLYPFLILLTHPSTEGDGGGKQAAYVYLHVVLLLLYQSISVHDVKYAASLRISCFLHGYVAFRK